MNIFKNTPTADQLEAVPLQDSRGVSLSLVEEIRKELQAKYPGAQIKAGGTTHFVWVTAYDKERWQPFANDEIRQTIAELIDVAIGFESVLDSDEDVGLMSDGRFRVFFNDRTYICRFGVVNGQLQLINDKTGGVAWQLWRALKRAGSYSLY